MRVEGVAERPAAEANGPVAPSSHTDIPVAPAPAPEVECSVCTSMLPVVAFSYSLTHQLPNTLIYSCSHPFAFLLTHAVSQSLTHSVSHSHLLIQSLSLTD